MGTMDLTYKGEVQPQPNNTIIVNPREGSDEQTDLRIYPYYPSQGLIEAVNLAIKLRLPLLLEGEPGVGKSRLAHSLVYELNDQIAKHNKKRGTKKEKPVDFYYWNVQSISKGQDALYTYDYVGRLQAAQLKEANLEDDDRDPKDIESFVEYQPLGLAFKRSKEEKRQAVVLIDEIDKADRDFPNDLLLAIEERAFYVKETRQTIKADDEAIPIIIITSNQERKLPDAFLRRCLYHYIEFPSDTEALERILSGRFTKSDAEVRRQAIARFKTLREKMEFDKGEGKKVSISELINWFDALSTYPEKDVILEVLNQEPLPFRQALLKSQEDIEEYGGEEE